MMIDITIKTLDSQNHTFSVGDELTVKQLKEHIAEPVNVPAESQRLIYCGRVLLDDKKLSDYDVNGKVIHLVQRAPPSSNSGGQTGNGVSSSSESRGGMRRPWRAVLNAGGGGAARIIDSPGGAGGGGGNAMYLGAMAFPADLMDAQGITMPLPRHGLSQSRLSVARMMLRRARYTLQNLENPTHQESPAELNSNNGDEGGVPPPALAANYFPQMNSTPSGAAAIAEGGVSGGEQPLSHEEVVHTTTEAAASSGSAAAAEPSQPSSTQEEATQSSSSGRNGNNGGRYPTTEALAELVSQMRDVNRRLQPFMDQYYELMRDDPPLDNPADAQRLFGRVSEMMHLMAHAYHALSDVMCNLSQPPPRFLRCRPVLIQHSAVLQTGIPIQAQINLSTSSAVSSNQSSTSNGNTETSATANGEGATVAASGEGATGGATEEASEGAGGAVTNPPEESGASAQTQSSLQSSGPGLGSGNFEFYMDVSPGSITFDSVHSTSGSNRSEPTAAAIAGPFPWGTTPPPEFIQTIMQALAGQMLGGTLTAASVTGGIATGGSGGAATTNVVTTAADNGGSGSAGSGSGNATTNSQARGNTATHPTTSTQTRSTSRPHVHFAPGIQGMGGQTFFDPFLPCNSHHICGGTRRRTGASTASQPSAPTPATSAATPAASTGGAASAAPSTTPSLQVPPPPPPPMPQSSSSTSEPNPPNRLHEFIYNGLMATGMFGPLDNGRQLSGGSGAGAGGSGSGSATNVFFHPRDIAALVQSARNFSARATTAEPTQDPLTTFIRGRNGQSLLMELFERLESELNEDDTDDVMHAMIVALRALVIRLLRGRSLDISNISYAIDNLNVQIRLFLESFLQNEDMPLREDVDIVATLSQLNHSLLPSIIQFIVWTPTGPPYVQVCRELSNYAHSLVAILHHYCQNVTSSADELFSSLVRRLMVEVPATFQEWVVIQMVARLRRMLNAVGEEEMASVRQYIVYRLGSTQQLQQQPQHVILSPPTTPVPEAVSPPPQPMETEERGPVVVEREVVVEPPLPDVIIGAEPWHNGLPPDWVPIIARDRERQRRGAVQGPLSEAYLSGMPTKRRKLVAATKPHGTLATVISESMASAIGAAGIAGGDDVAGAAGCDPGLRAAYRQEVRSSVEATLRSHPDYTPDKYPNAAKYFHPK